jgi:hypothetical protein
MNIDIPALMSSADKWEMAGYAASAVVVIGIILESVELVRYIRSGKSRERFVELSGLLLVIVGLAAEVITQVQSNNRTGLVIAALGAEAKASENKIADANMIAQSAVAEAGKLGVNVNNLHDFVTEQEGRNNSTIDELKRSAADLNKARDAALSAAQETKKDLMDMDIALTKERAVRQQMITAITPRNLSSEQSNEITKKIKSFAGTSVDILQIGETPEITNFRSLIEKTLLASGWEPITSTAVGSGSFVGISVGIIDNSSDADKAAASSLLAALNAAGIATTSEPFKRENWPSFVMAPQGITVNKSPLRLYIGAKP